MESDPDSPIIGAKVSALKVKCNFRSKSTEISEYVELYTEVFIPQFRLVFIPLDKVFKHNQKLTESYDTK